MSNASLYIAKKEKQDEFYTLYDDIANEVQAYIDYDPDVFRDKVILCPCDDPGRSNFTKYFTDNFQRLGIRKLISTCYTGPDNPGRYFIMSETALESGYLTDDGDFRKDSVTGYLKECDYVITNPPFSLFRDFMDWIMNAGKQFLIIGSVNAAMYNNVFPFIMNNQIWLGTCSGRMDFQIPPYYTRSDKAYVDETGNRYMSMSNVRWFTNMESTNRNRPMELMTMADNIRYGKHKIIREQGYPKYDNYDAIEVPYTDAIPSDYDGMMGVPITFLDRYCPYQFEILGMPENLDRYGLKTKTYTTDECKNALKYVDNPNHSCILKNDTGRIDLNRTCIFKNGDKYRQTYKRIFIKRKT